MRMSFGLIGTGSWARTVHGRALADHPETDLVGVWGRTPEHAEAVASELDTTAYHELDALLDDVDAVAIAVPPTPRQSWRSALRTRDGTYCWTSRSRSVRAVRIGWSLPSTAPEYGTWSSSRCDSRRVWPDGSQRTFQRPR
jgi:hypothetical protein